MNRDAHLERLREESFDVVVIGGGITGAGVARDAARRGFRTALVEARDFAEGTSSRSSRLIHGGLRYLEHLELDLVFEASRERRTLLEIAPHMVRPLEFLFPLFEKGRVGRRKLDAGMWLYDALSMFRNVERHQMLDEEELVGREPALRREGLLGGARYFDAQVDDARLVLANVVSAAGAGAAVANRVEATAIEREEGAVTGVQVRSEEGEAWTIPARSVVNATGPWTDRTVERAGEGWSRRMRPTRGTHVQVPREAVGHRHALIFESPLDDRIMFVLPWGDLTMIGTTDRDYEGDPADVVPTARDVAYLLASTNRLFPDAALTTDDVLSAWAGLRPLVTEEDGEEEAGAVSRDHVITEDAPGLVTVSGGKLTSYRQMAEDAVDRTADFLERAFETEPDRGCDTDEAPLPGGDFEELGELCRDLRADAGVRGVPPASVDRLARAHGTRAEEVLALAEDRSELAEPVVEDRPYLAAEVVRAARDEMALHVEDVVFRRTHLGRETRAGFEEACRRVADLMGEELGWDEGRRREEVERAAEVRRRDEAFREELEAELERRRPG